ncbi:hypothetical protein MCOR07_010110 [Pyricularia oryzae]|nr:hypothetical protein MCOR21_008363 [Pyricularia oryzae]KAI6488012.1 hypothetical protein MCOR18_002993 [Pyricularia oryzae]KAI6521222.1 hypothetical protein MCOR16_007988 [Pyricularia oryzae]KAI6611804.1 hypothetical protein MCOR07_010110 [Pyricularia oryzae]KAI6632170.1 hypothetical protein MCOR08_005596 [Pyricularia oryzae]
MTLFTMPRQTFYPRSNLDNALVPIGLRASTFVEGVRNVKGYGTYFVLRMVLNLWNLRNSTALGFNGPSLQSPCRPATEPPNQDRTDSVAGKRYPWDLPGW